MLWACERWVTYSEKSEVERGLRFLTQTMNACFARTGELASIERTEYIRATTTMVHSMKARLLLLLLTATVLSPMTFGIATTPASPWHEYVVRGNVLRATGSKANFSIALEGEVGRDRFQLLRGIYNGRWQSPVALTDSAGAFSSLWMHTHDWIHCESMLSFLTVTPFLVNHFRWPSQQVITEYTTVDYSDPTGCVGCRTTGKTSVVAGYVYNFPEQRIELPY
jgi:hypothetical protein